MSETSLAPWRARLFRFAFDPQTASGRAFERFLIAAILASLMVVMLDSVESISRRHGPLLHGLEWFFTLLFTVEYLARLMSMPKAARYARSFFGVVDLLAILPTYLALLVPGLNALIDVRVLRLLRIFRVLKLTHYFGEFAFLAKALAASRRKILVFLTVVIILVMVFSTVMYVVEGPENGFTSIPMAMYWGVTTMTTVGFGDITPKTDLGRFIASCMMLMGWGVLAVPTGIVTAEMAAGRRPSVPDGGRHCGRCGRAGLDESDRFCRQCGHPLKMAERKGRDDPVPG